MKPVKSEDKKPFGNQSVHINLKFKSQDGMEVSFRIKRNKKLQTLINEYCDKQSKETKASVFLFDGKQLSADKTPDQLEMEKANAEQCVFWLPQLEMEDGDEIQVALHMDGGGARSSWI